MYIRLAIGCDLAIRDQAALRYGHSRRLAIGFYSNVLFLSCI